MATYPIKMLKDENGTPFVPLISLDSIQDIEGQSINEILNKKLETTNLIAGTQIELEVDGNNITISSSAEGTKLINNLESEQAGIGALDAHQGKVLLEKIPIIANNLNTPESGQVLSAYQGYVLAGRVAPTGGAEGQVLKKASTNDYDFEWGDAADPNAIVGDGSIMKIIELTYEEYLELESSGQLQDDTEYHISDWNEARSTLITEPEIQEMINDSTNDFWHINNYIRINENTDLNTLNTPGFYRCESTEVCATLINVPLKQTTGFNLYVFENASAGSREYLRQEIKRNMRTFVRYTQDRGVSWSNWYVLAAYDIGDVYITSTPENPQGRLGGTWELIDKAFRVEQFAYSGEDISNYVTIENNSVDISQFVVRRIGHNVDIRIEMTTLVDLADTAVPLMTINVNAIGIKGFSYTKYGQLIGADGGNGFLNLTIYDYGQINSVDVLVRGDAPGTLPAGSSPRFYYSQEIVMANMLDDYCNQFYWKRTA